MSGTSAPARCSPDASDEADDDGSCDDDFSSEIAADALSIPTKEKKKIKTKEERPARKGDLFCIAKTLAQTPRENQVDEFCGIWRGHENFWPPTTSIYYPSLTLEKIKFFILNRLQEQISRMALHLTDDRRWFSTSSHETPMGHSLKLAAQQK